MIVIRSKIEPYVYFTTAGGTLENGQFDCKILVTAEIEKAMKFTSKFNAIMCKTVTENLTKQDLSVLEVVEI